MNKKGIELSVNMLVVIIIALVVFGFGIWMSSKFFGAAESQKAQIDQDTESAIENLLSGGTRVGIPINRKTIKRGSSDIFGLGVLNTGGQSDNFVIKVNFNRAYLPNDEEIEAPADDPSFINNNWILYDPSALIPNNDFVSIPILIKVQNSMTDSDITEKGIYIFNVCVCRDNPQGVCADLSLGCRADTSAELYGGSLKKIYVEVP